MNSYNPTRCFFLWRIRGLAGRFFGTVPREMISMILTSVLMNRFRFRFLYSHTHSFFLFHTQVGDPIRSHFLFFFFLFFYYSHDVDDQSGPCGRSLPSKLLTTFVSPQGLIIYSLLVSHQHSPRRCMLSGRLASPVFKRETGGTGWVSRTCNIIVNRGGGPVLVFDIGNPFASTVSDFPL